MIISLCGNKKDKDAVINNLKEVYGEKILVCDYFYLCFSAHIQQEKKKYDLEKKYDFITANKMFQEHINKIVDDEIKSMLNMKDKIIILVSDNILSRVINKTPYFDISDLKVLITSEKLDACFILNHANLYEKEDFDIILDTNNEIDVRKLVRI